MATVMFAGGAGALDLNLPPGAELVATEPAHPGDLSIAHGPFTAEAGFTTLARGIVQEFTWQVPDAATQSSAILAGAVSAQLDEQGYEIVFACADRACGGFDFRHALSVGEAPMMHVDLSDYRYIAAERVEETGERNHVAVMVSRGGRTAYLHLATITPPEVAPPPVTGSSRTPEQTAPVLSPTTSPRLIERLFATGAAALDDLNFQTGASELSGRNYPSLVTLAEFLAEEPARRVVLVGHTDAEGSLEGNIALSQARAEAVRRHLIDILGVSPDQVAAAGIGFLAPRAANDTDTGRQANRRVEVVLSTTD
ncbi:OmpA/MotB [Roseibacterium elongatum DSM 19469]|uniref:OmpA/MotB n=1 Tax=Roseicyclus elongatus DSM 19469 TaxID=1294273 RepID=W8RQM7_9RHOB|nr:OmpA/MotB [Roseibacterium elongatum DSM 19469]